MKIVVAWIALALSTQAALAAPVLPAAMATAALPIQSSGITLGLTPFFKDSAGSPQYIQPVRDGSGRLAINDTNGALFLTSAAGGVSSTPYLNLATATTGFDGAFMGLAFAPDFATSGTFYTAYQAASGTGVTPVASSVAGFDDIVIRAWTAANPAADIFSGTSREVMRMSMPSQGHTVGSIAFNPNATSPTDADYGLLYIGMGDTGDNGSYAVNAQNLALPYGKILRLDPTPSGTAGYTVPADNPFVSQAGAEPLVWAYGLRNPQSFSWEIGGAKTMYINDIGEGFVEEVDTGVAGGNYGWSTREGTFATFRDPTLGVGYVRNIFELTGTDPGLLYPVAQYFHDGSALAAIGSGVLYQGTDIPELIGKYIVADIPSGRLYVTDVTGLTSSGDPSGVVGFAEVLLDVGSGPESLLGILGASRADARLGVDGNGALYVTNKATGEIYAFTSLAPTPVPAPSPLGVLAVGVIVLAATRRSGIVSGDARPTV